MQNQFKIGTLNNEISILTYYNITFRLQQSEAQARQEEAHRQRQDNERHQQQLHQQHQEAQQRQQDAIQQHQQALAEHQARQHHLHQQQQQQQQQHQRLQQPLQHHQLHNQHQQLNPHLQVANARTKGRMPRKADQKPRGPMTAYAFFVQTCREEHKKLHPEENVVFLEFSKKCAERWKVSLIVLRYCFSLFQIYY